MKTLISIFLLFCSFVSYSQVSINDTFINCGTILTLNNNFTFNYFSGGCTAQINGKGKYHIIDNIITLEFENIEKIKDDNIIFKIDTNNCNHKDSLCLQINVENDKSVSSKVTYVFISDKNKSICWGNSFGKNNVIKIPKWNNYNSEVYVQMWGDKSLYFPLLLNSCKIINVNFKGERYNDSFYHFVKEGSKIIYQINKFPYSEECILYNYSETMTFTVLFEKMDYD